MKPYNTLILEQQGPLLLITINRPAKLNALNSETLAELHEAFADGFADDGTGCILLTGSGEKAFVAGADIAEFAEYGPEEGRAMAAKGKATVFDFIERGSKPVIAVINGFALGGGLELAMACSIRIAASTARMGLPEVTLGLIPGYGGTQRLTALAGKGRAMEMILSGEMITADEAFRIGLVNRVSAPGDLLSEARNLAATIVKRSPQAISAAIRAINACGSPDGSELETDEFGRCFGTADFKDGVSAFLGKKAPAFSTRFNG